MRRRLLITALFAVLGYDLACAQPVATGASPPQPVGDLPPLSVEWVPPALAQLGSLAAEKTSFTLDRSMLNTVSEMSGDLDTDTRQAVKKLDGVSVHILRFKDESIEDPVLMDEIRDAYHLRGWKHLVSTGESGTLHNDKADVWLVMDGIDFRGAVVLVEGVRTVTLATVSGNLKPVDLLHLRGHFGIPRFAGDQLKREH
jgi:hypothetical protein